MLGELLASVGVLVSMLEERIDPGSAASRELARLTRQVSRELGLDELTIGRFAVAAHLCGLDLALRREVGGPDVRCDAGGAFAAQADAPGGINPTLRMLGARALGLADEAGQPLGVKVLRMVTDYIELRAESPDETLDAETLVQLLRAGGTEPALLEALLRAMDDDSLPQTQRSELGEGRRRGSPDQD